MIIQNINMAVPVGRSLPRSGVDEAETEVAAEAAELEALTSSVLQLVRKHMRTVWSAGVLHERQLGFEVEMKGLVKRFVSGVAGEIADRDKRVQVRVRLYSDLLGLLNAVGAEISDCQRRRYSRRRAVWWVVALFVSGSVAANVVMGLALF